MARYHEPGCVAVDSDTGKECGTRMRALGERDPLFGPSWKPGCWVFVCKRCGAMRAIDKRSLGRYVSPV